jgi:hypothetical protein
MNDGRREPRSRSRHSSARSWASLILRDVQFWVPVAVLCGGLLVLRWIQ